MTSQFTPDEWYKFIPDAAIAEPIANRLVADAKCCAGLSSNTVVGFG